MTDTQREELGATRLCLDVIGPDLTPEEWVALKLLVVRGKRLGVDFTRETILLAADALCNYRVAH